MKTTLAASFLGTALSSTALAVFPGVIAINHGADPSGVADSAVAINDCLVAAGHGGVCWLTGGKFKVTSNINIPANTTLA